MQKNQSKIYPKNKKTNILIALFFSFFVIMGTGFLYFMFLTPIINIVKAKNWVEVPCVISKSQVASHSSDGSATYLVDISFTYQIDGKRYEGGKYNFNNSYSSGFQVKYEKVSQYPVGFKTKCFVDPKNPQDAVLNREFYSELWFSLIPLIFLVIGMLGIFYFLFYASNKRNPKGNMYYRNLNDTNNISKSGSNDYFVNPIVIKESSGLGIFLFVFAFSIFWSGIVVLSVSATNTSGAAIEFFDAIFSNLVIFIFAIFGLGLLLLSLYLFLKIFNPKFSIELISNKIYLGDDLKFKILSRSNLNNIKSFSISLIGLESATYSVGTNSKTDKQVFFEKDISVTGKLDQIIGYTLSVKIPLDKMHSFKSSHNEIQWKIILKGEIPMYPDINAEFIIKVGVK